MVESSLYRRYFLTGVLAGVAIADINSLSVFGIGPECEAGVPGTPFPADFDDDHACNIQAAIPRIPIDKKREKQSPASPFRFTPQQHPVRGCGYPPAKPPAIFLSPVGTPAPVTASLS